MHPLARRVSRALRDRALVSDGDRVAVAVSGGSDSVALALLLAEIAPRARWSLAGLVHVNHQLRPEADADEQFVADLAERMSLPFDGSRVDVPSLVREARRSVESVARDARYGCLAAAAARLGASVVATGHTMDDQAETVLMRLFRGAGSRGVSAVRPRRGIYARPLLDCRRSELRGYLAALGQPFRDDASNADRTVKRNRLRHVLMPVVEELAPGGVRALARFAALAADDERELSRQAQAAAASGVRSVGAGVQIDIGWLRGLPPTLGRRVIRDVIEDTGGTPTLTDVTAILALARRDRAPGTVHVHKLTVSRSGNCLTVASPAIAEPHVAFSFSLPVPGRVELPETGGVVLASLFRGTDTLWRTGREAGRVALQAGTVQTPLLVRTRRPGDRLRPLGAPGSRSLQDLFIDRKVPRPLRDRMPVVVDNAGRIVWVPGVAMAHECRVTMPEAGMVILELEKSHQ